MQAIGKLLAVLFYLLAAMVGVMGVSQIVDFFGKGTGASQPTESLVMMVVVDILMAWLFIHLARRLSGKSSRSAAPSDAMVEAATAWMKGLDERRQFARADVGSMLLPRDEFPLLSETVSMIEQTTQTTRAYGGTRVKVGNMPFYFGGSAPITKQVLRTAAKGRLVLTDKELLFSGDARTVSADIGKLLSVESYSRDAIIVSVRDKAKPLIFTVANPIIWALTIRMATQLSLDHGVIPDRAAFDFGNEAAAQPA